MSARPTPFVLAVHLDPQAGLSSQAFRRACAALRVQLVRDVAPAWKVPAPIVVVLDGSHPPPAGAIVLDVVPTITDVPDAQGFHTPIGDGQVDGYISTEGVDEAGAIECLGHELIETLVDPSCSEGRSDAQGTWYPLEACDAVQGQRYPVDLGDGGPPVMVPNFCLPSWWQANGAKGTAVDHMGRLDGAFHLAPEGYAAVTYPDGSTAQIGAELSVNRRHRRARIQRRLGGRPGQH